MFAPMTLRTRALVVAWSFAALFAYFIVDTVASMIWRGIMSALGFDFIMVGLLKNWTGVFGFYSYGSVMDRMQRVPGLSRVRRGFVTFGALFGLVLSTCYYIASVEARGERPVNAWWVMVVLMGGWGVGAFLGTFAPRRLGVPITPPEPARDLSWLGVQKP